MFKKNKKNKIKLIKLSIGIIIIILVSISLFQFVKMNQSEADTITGLEAKEICDNYLHNNSETDVIISAIGSSSGRPRSMDGTAQEWWVGYIEIEMSNTTGVERYRIKYFSFLVTSKGIQSQKISYNEYYDSLSNIYIVQEMDRAIKNISIDSNEAMKIIRKHPRAKDYFKEHPNAEMIKIYSRGISGTNDSYWGFDIRERKGFGEIRLSGKMNAINGDIIQVRTQSYP